MELRNLTLFLAWIGKMSLPAPGIHCAGNLQRQESWSFTGSSYVQCLVLTWSHVILYLVVAHVIHQHDMQI